MNHTTREMRTRLTEQKRLDQIAHRAKSNYDNMCGRALVATGYLDIWKTMNLTRAKAATYAVKTRKLGEQLPYPTE